MNRKLGPGSPRPILARANHADGIDVAWTQDTSKIHLKNDRYRRARGGKAVFLTLFCAGCQSPLLLYQKDGSGTLQRCYLNRIFAPANLESLQHDLDIRNPQDMEPLKCRVCKAVVGLPMCHTDGRLAFRLNRGAFIRKVGVKDSLAA